MNARRNPAASIHTALARTAPWPALILLLCAALAGCRHRIAHFTPPVPPQIPLESVNTQPGGHPPVIAPTPPPVFGPLPPLNPPVPPQRHHSSSKDEPASTAPATDEAAPADLAIGSLTTGADATPQIQQQAQDMISSMRKSIAALPSRAADAQRRQVRQVRHFLDQAQQALNTGDTEGAKNLATKARLLMDDLEKR